MPLPETWRGAFHAFGGNGHRFTQAQAPGFGGRCDPALAFVGGQDHRLAGALTGLEAFEQIEVLYWLHQSRRDLILQSPHGDGGARGTFALRSPIRPNPIGTSIVRLMRIEGNVLFVRGLDCLDGTPLIDLKPDRCLFSPNALLPDSDALAGAS